MTTSTGSMDVDEMAASPEAVLHLAALHLLSLAGFASTSRVASLTLSSVTERYFRLIATTCTEKAALAGRSKVAAADIVAALEELGYGLDELEDWMGDDESGTRFDSRGVEVLEDYLHEGRQLNTAISDLTLVPRAELEDSAGQLRDESDADEDEDEDEEGVVVVKTEDMEVDEAEIKAKKPVPAVLLDPAPDPLSWLPPLPGVNSDFAVELGEVSGRPRAAAAAQAGPRSLAERYRTPIPYESSILAGRAFADPPEPAKSFQIPPKTSSLPALLEAYKAIQSEPTVSLRQTDIRRQEVELLKRSIAPPDQFLPSDTLSASLTSLPLPRTPVVMPSYNITDPDKPVGPVPVNTNPTGLLASLARQIQSPYLPPSLRARLTTVRPPQPLMRDGQPILYGEAVRAPDKAALDKARGKPVDPADEQYLRATWDAGPKGMEKWARAELPSGKKVIASGEGEDVPRQPGGKSSTAPVRLRLRGDLSPGAGAGPGQATSPVKGQHQPPTPSTGTTTGTGISLNAPNPFAAEANARPRLVLSPSGVSPTTVPPKAPSPAGPAAISPSDGGGTTPKTGEAPKLKFRLGGRASVDGQSVASPALEVPKTTKLRMAPPANR